MYNKDMGKSGGAAEASGFTIIEVMLTLAISGMVLVGALLGVSSTISRQRYRDTVEDIAFTAEITDYRVFEEDDGFPKQDGREYRIMTVHLAVKSTDYGRTYYIGPISSDYYNLRLYEGSVVTDDSGMETHTVIYNGVPTECTIWERSSGETRDGYFHINTTWTASVPVGYDGLVVGLYNRHLNASDRYLDEYYTSESDFMLYRMN